MANGSKTQIQNAGNKILWSNSKRRVLRSFAIHAGVEISQFHVKRRNAWAPLYVTNHPQSIDSFGIQNIPRGLPSLSQSDR